MLITCFYCIFSINLSFFRSDESLGSPSSSIAGISNGSAGAAEKASLRWDNVNNNNNLNGNHNNVLFVGSNTTNVPSGSGVSFNLHGSSQLANNNNSLGIYSGASSLSGDNMSIGSITDIPGTKTVTSYVFQIYVIRKISFVLFLITS